ncbi:MAG: hypothetical protein QOG80_2287 [Pseudonocardiales bacterium]|nr:hypothetical protein [Pseudonocardiales bacterium]
MYGRNAIAGITIGTGGLAVTGFAIAWFVLAASTLLVSGLLFIRWGRRRGAAR